MNTNYTWTNSPSVTSSSFARNPLDADGAADSPAGTANLSIQDSFHGSDARGASMFSSWFCSTKPYHCD